MRIYSKRELFAHDMLMLLDECIKRGYGVTFGEFYRTKEQQELHRKAGRSKVKTSQHQKRLAGDLHLWSPMFPSEYISDEEWKNIGEFWCTLSPKNRWGGNYGVPKVQQFKKMGWDKWHFERRG